MTGSGQHRAPHGRYRPDIDGLRAIAILSVVAFHAFPGVVKGGFVGVDIFFVISGYIISTTLCKSLGNNSFSFSGFYRRRIKRIFPSLALVMVASYVFGWFFLLPDRFHQLCKHITAGAGFASNFALWREAGYFDNSADTKPLLHLWSLGIEEQFYIVWPVLLSLGWKIRSRLAYIIGAITAASFAFNLAVVDHDLVAAYYSPLARFWEIFAGCLLSYLAYNRAPPGANAEPAPSPAPGDAAGNRISNPDGMAILGMLLIVLACLVIDKEKRFPGYLALLPTAGTALLLWAGPDAWFNRKVLGAPPLVLVGLISYPLYLWHWMLLSFARISEGGTPPPEARLLVVLASFALAWLTYKFVERPIRNGANDTLKVATLCSVMVLIGCGGYYKYLQGDSGGRYPYQLYARNLQQLSWASDPDADCLRAVGLEGEVKRKQGVLCTLKDDLDKVQVAVIGDCTANDLYPGLEKLYRGKNVGVINIGNGTCAPFRGLRGTLDYNRECLEVNNKIYDFLLGNQEITTVVLSFAAWDIKNMRVDGLADAAPLADRFAAVSKLVNKDLTDLVSSGKSVYVTFDSPNLGKDPRKFIVAGLTGKGSVIKEKDFPLREPYLSMWQDMLGKRTDISVFYKFPDIMRDRYLNVLDESGTLLYRDDHHLSYVGSDLVARRFMNLTTPRNRSAVSSSL